MGGHSQNQSQIAETQNNMFNVRMGGTGHHTDMEESSPEHHQQEESPFH